MPCPVEANPGRPNRRSARPRSPEGLHDGRRHGARRSDQRRGRTAGGARPRADRSARAHDATRRADRRASDRRRDRALPASSARASLARAGSEGRAQRGAPHDPVERAPRVRTGTPMRCRRRSTTSPRRSRGPRARRRRTPVAHALQSSFASVLGVHGPRQPARAGRSVVVPRRRPCHLRRRGWGRFAVPRQTRSWTSPDTDTATALAASPLRF